jgi:hypothetical protein
MIETLARLGYASKAAIYAIVGCLAGAAAMNWGGRVTDQRGALRLVLSQPYGHAILVVLAVGLFGYAGWRVLDAIFDPDRHGTSPLGLVTRIGRVLRAAIYGMLGLEAVRLARGLRGGGREDAQVWTARVMAFPLGDEVIAIAGVIVVAYGVAQIVGAARKRIDRSIDVTRLPSSLRDPLIDIGRFGVAARAVIIIVVGFFLIRAAVKHDPSEAVGLRGSILELAGSFEGRWVLASISFGLIAYAVDQVVHAWCRRIRSPI